MEYANTNKTFRGFLAFQFKLFLRNENFNRIFNIFNGDLQNIFKVTFNFKHRMKNKKVSKFAMNFYPKKRKGKSEI